MRHGHELLYNALAKGDAHPNSNRVRMVCSKTHGEAKTVRDMHVLEMVSRASWTTNDSLGYGVQEYVPLPSVRFLASDVVYHSHY